MPNSEPVYQHQESRLEIIDTKVLNQILAEYHSDPLDQQCNILDIIRLRHSMIALLLETPKSRIEYDTLTLKAQEVLREKIWSSKDQEKILKICSDCWLKKMLPNLLEKISVQIDQKHNELPCHTRTDLKFAFRRHATLQTPREEFLLEHALPILLPLKLERTQLGVLYTFIASSYAKLTNFD